MMGAAFGMRAALQAGLSTEQLRSIGSGQALRVAAAEPLEPQGPPIGARDRASHVLLDRVAEFVMLTAMASMRGGEPEEMLALARMACDVPADIDDAPVFAAILRLLDAYSEAMAAMPDERRSLTLLILAATVARTPDVPIPADF
jgi:hypothetical protein